MQSVERALAVLRALAVGPAGVTDLSQRLDLPKSTVARLLATLETLAAVEQLDGGGPYRLGPLVAEIASGLAPYRSLPEVAGPFLAELSRLTGEVSGLSVRDGDSVRYIAQTTSDAEVQVRDWTGESVPLHAVPSGLVVLAHLTADQIDAYFTEPLRSFTPSTVVDPAEIERRLAIVRDTGSVWVRGEFSADINSVAAPIFDASGAVVAALHAHGPSYRFPGTKTPSAISQQVHSVAAKLTDRLRAP